MVETEYCQYSIKRLNEDNMPDYGMLKKLPYICVNIFANKFAFAHCLYKQA